jgi:hypothetical protein
MGNVETLFEWSFFPNCYDSILFITQTKKLFFFYILIT